MRRWGEAHHGRQGGKEENLRKVPEVVAGTTLMTESMVTSMNESDSQNQAGGAGQHQLMRLSSCVYSIV